MILVRVMSGGGGMWFLLMRPIITAVTHNLFYVVGGSTFNNNYYDGGSTFNHFKMTKNYLERETRLITSAVTQSLVPRLFYVSWGSTERQKGQSSIDHKIMKLIITVVLKLRCISTKFNDSSHQFNDPSIPSQFLSHPSV